MDRPYNPRSSSLLRHSAAWPQPLRPRPNPQTSQEAESSQTAHFSPPSTPTTPTQAAFLPSNLSDRSGSSTPTYHPLGHPSFLGIPSLLREGIYTHLLSPRSLSTTPSPSPSTRPLIPYSSHTFPSAVLCVCRHLHSECRAFLTVNNTFNIVLNGTGIAPGGLFSPATATTPRVPRAGWITSLRVHLHLDLSGLFFLPPAPSAAAAPPRGGNGTTIIEALEKLMVLMWQVGMPCLSRVELVVLEVIPEVLRIHPTCAIYEPTVRQRYRALAKPLFKGLGNAVSVVVVGVEGVYVPDLVGEVEEMAGIEEGGEGEEGDADTPEGMYAGLGRRQGSEQARVPCQGMDKWERAEDYEFLCMESLKELGKDERGPQFVDECGIEGGLAVGYGPREVFGSMVRVSDPFAGGEQKEEEAEEEEEEEEGEERRSGLAVPSEGKRRGLSRFVSESRLALRLSAGGKDKDKPKEEGKAEKEAEKMLQKMEREREKEAKERLREKEKLEKEREKQRVKAKKEQDKLDKKAEKRKSEGNKDVDSPEQKEGLRDKMRWLRQKKDRDETERRNPTW